MAIQMGKVICYLRKQQGLTQEELGEGIVSKSAMSRIETGQEIPSVLVLHRLMEKLGATLEHFEIVVSSKEYETIKNWKDDFQLSTIVISENDILREIRLAKGLSQEQLCRDICARETISNIEHGRTSNRKKMEDLLMRLGELPDKYHGYVDTLEYGVYELVQQYQCLLNANIEEAKIVRMKIGQRLDGNNPVNRQFMESSELIEKKLEGKLQPEEIIEGLEECLRYTMPEYDGAIYRIPYRQEVVILETMAELLHLLQKDELATGLRENLLEKNEKKLKISQNVTAFFKKVCYNHHCCFLTTLTR